MACDDIQARTLVSQAEVSPTVQIIGQLRECASSPGGGSERADSWLRANHPELVTPAPGGAIRIPSLNQPSDTTGGVDGAAPGQNAPGAPGMPWQQAVAGITAGKTGNNAPADPAFLAQIAAGLDQSQGTPAGAPPAGADPMQQFLGGTMAGRSGAMPQAPGGQGAPSELDQYFNPDPNSWLNSTGMGWRALQGLDPLNNQLGMQRAAELFEQSDPNRPDYYGRQMAPWFQAMAGADLLASPGQSEPGSIDFLNRMPEYNKLLNTPGLYLDEDAMYDNIFSGIGQGPGGGTAIGGTAQQLQGMLPEEQIQTVMGAFGAMEPFMSKGAANDVTMLLSEAAIDWMNMVDSGDTTYPDFLSYLASIGAADWM